MWCSAGGSLRPREPHARGSPSTMWGSASRCGTQAAWPLRRGPSPRPACLSPVGTALTSVRQVQGSNPGLGSCRRFTETAATSRSDICPFYKEEATVPVLPAGVPRTREGGSWQLCGCRDGQGARRVQLPAPPRHGARAGVPRIPLPPLGLQGHQDPEEAGEEEAGLAPAGAPAPTLRLSGDFSRDPSGSEAEGQRCLASESRGF